MRFLAIEDRKFRTHHGFDFIRTARAAFLTITGRRREGGSTLTQQLAKNAFLSPEQTLTRKIKEADFSNRNREKIYKRRNFGKLLEYNLFWARSIRNKKCGNKNILIKEPKKIIHCTSGNFSESS